MENPWKHLPKREPFVLDIDEAQVAAYNTKFLPDDANYVHLDLMPEPFLGDPQAPVVLLGLNPGYSKSDRDFYHQYWAACRLNLEHAPQTYPFYLLNPDYDRSKYTGPKWWHDRLSALIKATGNDLKKVAEKVCCIEFFPYHSGSFNAHGVHLGSAHYRNQLVEQAIKDNHLIIIMRSVKIWQTTIPRLVNYSDCCQLNNPQQVYISDGNLPNGWFDRIISAIQG